MHKKFYTNCHCSCPCFSSSHSYNLPDNYCICQFPICHCQKKWFIKPMSYRKLSSMPSKAKPNSAFDMTKDNGKLKKKHPTTKKTNKTGANENESAGNQCPEASGTKRGSYDSSDMAKRSESADNACFCKCSCKSLDKVCQRCEKPDLLLLPFYGLPFKKDQELALNSSSHASQNTASNCNRDMPYNDNIMNMVRKASRSVSSNCSFAPPKQMADTEKSSFAGCCSSERSTARSHSSRNNNCHCCTKKSAAKTKRSRCLSHLDVINEEEAEMEMEKQKEPLETADVSHKPCNLADLKQQKSLEDTCVDFLNIVTDNILESVQKSVTTTLQDFCCKTSEKIDRVYQRLEQNEQAMRCLSGNIVEKITARNENELKKILVLLEQLKESQEDNKRRVSKIVCQNTESQCELCPEFNIQDIRKMSATIERKQSIISNSLRESCQDSEKRRTSQLCECCSACGGRNSSLKTTKIQKSYSSSTIIQKSVSSESLIDLKDKPRDCCRNKKRESGGGIYELETQKAKTNPAVSFHLGDMEAEYIRKESLDILTGFEEKTPIVENSQNLEPIKTLNNNCSSIKKLLPSPRSNSPHLYTCFSITPNGKTVFNCNCCLKKHKSGLCNGINTSHAVSNENYDTSGYASEPEDNNEASDSNTNGPKKSSKSIPIRLQYVRRDNITFNEMPKGNQTKSKKHSKKRSSKGERSTPTRLSRL